MQDVVIERCTVRVVRRSGWSWGADRRALIRRVTDALPALIAERLAALLGNMDRPATIAEPIRVRLKLRLSDILATSPAGGGALPARAWRARFDAAIDEAVSAAVEPTTVAATAVDPPTESPSYRPASARHFVDDLIGAIRAWRKAGLLAAVIERLDDPQVHAWIEALAQSESSVEAATAEGPPSAALIDAQAYRVTELRRLASLRQFVPPPHEPAGVGQSQWGESYAPKRSIPVSARQRDPKRGSTPVEIDVTTAVSAPPSASSPQSRAARIALKRGSHPQTPAVREASIVEGEVQVPSALPWLILGPLHKFGYLRTLGAALEAASLSTEAPLFGAALALKLTPPAERPWSKSTLSEQLASAAAARRQPIVRIDLHRFGDRIAPYCPLIDAAIMSPIVAGRDRRDPWVVHCVPAPADAGDVAPRYGVVDPTGLFPVAWGFRAIEVAAIVRDQPGAGCVIVEDTADPVLTSVLEEGGVRFFTTARPGRSESWQGIAGLPPWRTNRSGDMSAATRRWLRGIDEIAPRLDAIAGEFGARRIALARDPVSSLEHSLALAVSAALATLAWSMWHPREVTDALLMLQRFEDLDARVRFTPRAVRVTVPLGRRHRDLLDHGLLASVNDVPWLDGRVLEFSGG